MTSCQTGPFQAKGLPTLFEVVCEAAAELQHWLLRVPASCCCLLPTAAATKQCQQQFGSLRMRWDDFSFVFSFM